MPYKHDIIKVSSQKDINIDQSITFNGIYLQGQFITLHKDPNWFGHELASHLQDLMRKSCRNQTHLFKGKQIHNHVSLSKSQYFLSSKRELTKATRFPHCFLIMKCAKCVVTYQEDKTDNKITWTEQKDSQCICVTMDALQTKTDTRYALCTISGL